MEDDAHQAGKLKWDETGDTMFPFFCALLGLCRLENKN